MNRDLDKAIREDAERFHLVDEDEPTPSLWAVLFVALLIAVALVAVWANIPAGLPR